jgi:tRNA nucleotidyltransferase (CCA-adding enzyme)
MLYKLPKEVKDIFNQFKKKGFEIYAVGGAVRDILLNQEIKDWDFTTNATPSDILSVFPDGFYDNKFGTVGIPIKIKSGGKTEVKEIIEITTFRSESGYKDHRHPDQITWGETLDEDLQRRDFTINAIAFDGNKFTDLYGGEQDLQNKLIRTVGNPVSRFNEDGLRMMRAIRIATQLQFLIEDKTLEAIQMNSQNISAISTERIRDELFKILASNYPADGIRLLKNSGLLRHILPELEKCFGIEQKSPKRHHKFDVGTHSLVSLEKCPSLNPIVRFATLIHDTGKAVTYNKTKEGVITFYNHEIISASIARNIAEKFHFSREQREKFVKLVRWHQFTVDEKQTDSALRRFITNVGKENLEDMISLRIGDRLGGGATETSWRLELFKKRLAEVQKKPFSVSDLKVNGYDVMKIYNTGPGKLIGAILDMIFNDVIEAKLKNDREILLKRISDLYKESHS